MLRLRVTNPDGFVPTIISSPPAGADLEIPAGGPMKISWSATAQPGRRITGYRWALDLVQRDSTEGDDDGSDDRDGDGNKGEGHDEGRHNSRIPRAGHWSLWSLTNTSATIGPFAGGETHRFYIEAREGAGCGGDAGGVGRAIITLTTVRATPGPKILIVNDTRLVLDRVNPGTSCDAPVNRPTGNWPTAAELDTFLFARGGVPWRCYPQGTVSTPGIFYGYDFDTLGTNTRTLDLTVR